MKKYTTFETSEGPIQIMLLSEGEENMIKSFKAATISLNPKRGEWLTPETVDRDFARINVIKMFIENYFMIGMSWDVDEDSMTDEERQLWEQAGEDVMDRWMQLEGAEIIYIVSLWENESNKEFENIMAIAAFEQQLETI